jgi:hypothetical protein
LIGAATGADSTTMVKPLSKRRHAAIASRTGFGSQLNLTLDRGANIRSEALGQSIGIVLEFGDTVELSTAQVEVAALKSHIPAMLLLSTWGGGRLPRSARLSGIRAPRNLISHGESPCQRIARCPLPPQSTLPLISSAGALPCGPAGGCLHPSAKPFRRASGWFLVFGRGWLPSGSSAGLCAAVRS